MHCWWECRLVLTVEEGIERINGNGKNTSFINSEMIHTCMEL